MYCVCAKQHPDPGTLSYWIGLSETLHQNVPLAVNSELLYLGAFSAYLPVYRGMPTSPAAATVNWEPLMGLCVWAVCYDQPWGCLIRWRAFGCLKYTMKFLRAGTISSLPSGPPLYYNRQRCFIAQALLLPPNTLLNGSRTLGTTFYIDISPLLQCFCAHTHKHAHSLILCMCVCVCAHFKQTNKDTLVLLRCRDKHNPTVFNFLVETGPWP